MQSPSGINCEMPIIGTALMGRQDINNGKMAEEREVVADQKEKMQLHSAVKAGICRNMLRPMYITKLIGSKIFYKRCWPADGLSKAI